MTKLVIKYLTAPPTSVPSEFLFSVVGDVYYEKQTLLAPEKAEMLLFYLHVCVHGIFIKIHIYSIVFILNLVKNID